jgi:ABC-2 type transport system ATP-binding protein
MSAEATWGIRAVSVRHGNRLALDRVSFDVLPGQVNAVVGGDGTGRSTLLRCLSGGVTPGDGEVCRPPRRDIGYLPARPGLYLDLTVAENLEFRASAYHLRGAEGASRIARYLERAGLAAVSDRLARTLSGGMRRKLGLITAMLHEPALLVLDEPTNGLDPVSRLDVWSLMAEAAARGAAVCFATSYLEEAERASRVLVLDEGHPLAMGTPGQVVSAMPGAVRRIAERPRGAAAARCWRRNGRWRIWDAAATGHDGDAIQPDLRDAVTVAIMRRELARAGVRDPGDEREKPAAVPATRHPAAGTLAECSRVSRRFGRVMAVDQVDLITCRGEVVGLLGANGAGKTTLIRLLMGLLPVSGGTVRLLGGPPTREARQRIGYVPQGLGLYADLTPAENLAFSDAVFGSKAHLPPGMLGSARVPVRGLPLGTRRRIALSGALAHEPDLLILDEPTSGVDPLARARLWETIASAAAAGAGVLMTTHYMEEADECDRLLILAGGRVVAAGMSRDIVGDARVSVVETDQRSDARAALELAGFRTAPTGRTLRVACARPSEIQRALGSIPARVTEARATLEERFFQLTVRSSARGGLRQSTGER